MQRSVRFWLASLGLMLSAFTAWQCLGSRPAETGAGVAFDSESRDLEAFAIDFVTPSKELAVTDEITVMFSRSVRELTDESIPPQIHMDPSIKGKFHWIGTRILVFQPEANRLPFSSEFSLKIDAGIKSVDGEVLTEVLEFNYTTASPQLLNFREQTKFGETLDSRTAELVGYSPGKRVFRLELDQPVALSLLQEMVQVATLTRQGKGEQLQPRWTADGDYPGAFYLTVPLATLDGIDIVIPPGFHGIEGKRLSTESRHALIKPVPPFTMSTPMDENPNEPLSSTWLSVQMSTPVACTQLKKYIQLNGKAAKIDWPCYREDSTTSSYNLGEGIVYGGKVALKANASLHDVYGQPLSGTKEWRGSVRDYPSSLSIKAYHGKNFAATKHPVLNLQYMNVRKAEYLVFPGIGGDDGFGSDEDGRENIWNKTVQKLGPKAVVQLGDTKQLNKSQVEAVDLSKYLSDRGTGWLQIMTRYIDRDSGNPSYNYRSLNFTTLEAHSKVHAVDKDESTALVQVLRNNQPVSGAVVKFSCSSAKWQELGETSSKGQLSAKISDHCSRYDESPRLLVQEGGEYVFLDGESEISPWSFDVSVSWDDAGSSRAVLFSERDAYRPGEQVYFKTVIRKMADSGLVADSNRQLQLKIHSYDGEQEETPVLLKLSTNDYGTASGKFTLSSSLKLGYHSLVVMDGDEVVASKKIYISEFRAPPFEAKLIAARGELDQKDVAAFEIEANYLFGSPLSGGLVNITHQLSAASYSPPGGEAYSWNFSDSHSWEYRDWWEAEDLDPLDEEGRMSYQNSKKWKMIDVPRILETEILIRSTDQQSVAARSELLIHSSSVYVGLAHPESWFFEANKPIKLPSRVVDWQGRPQKGYPVQYELFLREYNSGKQKIASCAVNSDTQDQSCSLKPTDPGYYSVMVTTRDKSGRPSRAEIGIWVIGTNEAQAYSEASESQFTLPLQLDRKSYLVNQKVKILVDNTYNKSTQALLTIERDRILVTKDLTLKPGSNLVELPIDPSWFPNVFLSIEYGRPEGAFDWTRKDPKKSPPMRMGLVEISVRDPNRELAVTVSPDKKEAAPGDWVSVEVVTADKKGAKVSAELALYAVDEAVLALTSYKTPNLADTFHRAVKFSGINYDSRLFKGVLASGSGDEKTDVDEGEWGGGGEEGGASKMRSDFRATAFFTGQLVSDKNGIAKAKFKLPDNLTRYRIMAVVNSKNDHYGRGESSVVASKELMVRPILPRFLRVGDRLSGRVLVQSKDKAEMSVALASTAKGVKLQGGNEPALKLSSGLIQEVGFECQATKEGDVLFQFDGKSAAARDRIELKIPVHVPQLEKTMSFFGSFDGELVERVGQLEPTLAGVGDARISLSADPSGDLSSQLSYFSRYPYSCTEQLSSKLVASAVKTWTKSSKFKNENDSLPAVDKLLTEIFQRQHGSGLLSYYSDSDADLWLSVYVDWVISSLESQFREFKLSKKNKDAAARLNRALASLVTFPKRPEKANADSGGEAVNSIEGWDTVRTIRAAAYRLDAEAMRGELREADLNQAFESIENMDWGSKALLLHAAARVKLKTSEVKQLSSELMSYGRADGKVIIVNQERSRYSWMPSERLESQALIFRALIESKVSASISSGWAMGLNQLLGASNVSDTHSQALGLMALSEFKSILEASPFDGALRVGSETILELNRDSSTEKSSVNQSLTLERLKELSDDPWNFKSKRGRGFYQLEVRYIPKALDFSPQDAGFVVKRVTRDSAAKLCDAGQTCVRKLGDEIVHELWLISSKPREHLLLEMPVSAGEEIVDSNFSNEAQLSTGRDAEAESTENYLAGRGTYLSGNAYQVHRQNFDDRVAYQIGSLEPGIYRFSFKTRLSSKGDFILPSAKAVLMYEAMVYGSSGAQRVTVQ